MFKTVLLLSELRKMVTKRASSVEWINKLGVEYKRRQKKALKVSLTMDTYQNNMKFKNISGRLCNNRLKISIF